MKRFLKSDGIAALLIGLSLLMAGCGGKEERVAAHLQKGRAYYEQANYPKARVELRNVLQIAPKNSEAHYLLGLIEEDQQEWRRAFNAYAKVVELDPDHLPAKAKLARIYVFSGAVDQAEKIASEILARSPGHLGARFVKAAVMTRKGDVPGAILEASQIVAADASQFDAASLLGGLYVTRGEDAKAQDVLEKGVKASPRNIPLRMDLASLYVRRNEFDKAAPLLQEVIAIDPRNLARRTTLASLYAQTKQMDKAEKVLREAIQANPEDVQRYFMLVEFLATTKGADQAEKELISAIQAKPNAYPLQFGLARLYESTRRTEQAEQIYRKVIADAKSRPDGLKARVLLARSRLSSGESAEAEKLLAQALAENRSDGDALRLRARMSLSRGDARQAIPDLRVVLRDHPEDIEVMNLLSSAYLANNEPQLAKDVYSNAVVRYPNNVNLRLALATFLAGTNDYDGAMRELDTALKADPRGARAYQLKADVQIARKDWSAAEKTLRELKAAFPADPVGDYRLGMLYLAQGKLDQATTEYESALKKAPAAIEPLTGVVTVLLAQGRDEKAVARINQAVQAMPGNARPYLLLANVHAKQKKYTDAEQALRKASEVDQRAPGPYVGLANLHMLRGDAPAAVEVLQQGAAAGGADPLRMSYALAHTYESAGERAKAIAEYEKILEKNPRADVAANNLAVLLSGSRGNKADLDRALALAKRFEGTANPAFLDTIGWTYYQRDDIERALPLLRKAVEIGPNSPSRQYHLGMALNRLGDVKAAKTHLQLAVDSKAKFAGIEEAAATLAELR